MLNLLNKFRKLMQLYAAILIKKYFNFRILSSTEKVRDAYPTWLLIIINIDPIRILLYGVFWEIGFSSTSLNSNLTMGTGEFNDSKIAPHLNGIQ
ncbi:hypothetical protein TI04_09790 [Achromatium sp. WMS2]|nr:hypothetical protein TI04_09790 [Achromatium sp. WMS2]